MSGLVALSAAEFGSRLYLVAKYKAGEARYLASESRVFDPCPAQEYEYKTRPNLARVSPVNPRSRVTTNSQGFRGLEFSRHKTPDRFRVAFYGDSFTFGDGVSDEETFPHRLGESLNVESLNFGVSGYNTVQELALMRETLDAYSPDLVVLSYFLNDPQPHYSLLRHPRWEFKHAWLWSWEWAKCEINDLLALSDAAFRFDTRRLVYSSDWADGFRDNSLKWKTSREALRGMKAFCQARNIPLVVLVLPTFNGDFRNRESYAMISAHNKVVRTAAELEIPCLDVLSEFIGENSQKYVVDRGGHPNAKGHWRIARRVSAPISSILNRNGTPVNGTLRPGL